MHPVVNCRVCELAIVLWLLIVAFSKSNYQSVVTHTRDSIVLHFAPRSPKWSPPFRFSSKILHPLRISATRNACLAHLILLKFITANTTI
jgi:hypothetical protein